MCEITAEINKSILRGNKEFVCIKPMEEGACVSDVKAIKGEVLEQIWPEKPRRNCDTEREQSEPHMCTGLEGKWSDDIECLRIRRV